MWDTKLFWAGRVQRGQRRRSLPILWGGTFTIIDIPFDPVELEVDLDLFRKVAPLVRPKVVTLGASMTLFPFPIQAIHEIVAEWGGYVFFDGAHQLGLVAGGQFQDPLREGAAVMTGSAGKTFSGPQSGIMVWDDAQLTQLADARCISCVGGNASGESRGGPGGVSSRNDHVWEDVHGPDCAQCTGIGSGFDEARYPCAGSTQRLYHHSSGHCRCAPVWRWVGGRTTIGAGEHHYE